METASSRVANAKRNLWLYPIQKVFNKRVFLPIIPIYYTMYVGFSVPEVGLIAALYGLINIVFNIPSGYFADRFGRAKALRLGAFLLVLSTVFYVAFPTKIGILIGVIFEAIGFAFVSGAGESLTHDSLEVLHREKEYSKVLSRAQSLALIANAILVALVPLTYAIDPRLPFAIGTLAFVILLVATFFMRDVKVHELQPITWKGLDAMQRIKGNGRLLFAVALFGVVGAIYFAFDIMTIALHDFGLSPEYLGWVFAAASIVGAIMGLFIHLLKRVSLMSYMIIDVSILFGLYVAGWSGSLWGLVIMVVLSTSFWRYRRIIYQDHLLTRYKTGYKSTILSVMNTAENLNMLWVPIVTTAVVGAYGITTGFGILGLGVFGFGVIYILSMRAAFTPYRESEA